MGPLLAGWLSGGAGCWRCLLGAAGDAHGLLTYGSAGLEGTPPDTGGRGDCRVLRRPCARADRCRARACRGLCLCVGSCVRAAGRGPVVKHGHDFQTASAHAAQRLAYSAAPCPCETHTVSGAWLSWPRTPRSCRWVPSPSPSPPPAAAALCRRRRTWCARMAGTAQRQVSNGGLSLPMALALSGGLRSGE
jgi:hypothetical protein